MSGTPQTWRTVAVEPGPSRVPDGDGWVVGGRYELGDRIGAGGFGTVWRAVDAVADRAVAVKWLPSRTASGVGRMRREMAALRAASVPGVVRLLDEVVDARGAWIVMELLVGRQFLAGHGDWGDVCDDAMAMLRTLMWVHRRGLVHGDLKPGNVIVVPGRGPVLLDFGISGGRALGTEAGPLGYTRPYAAPEVLDGAPPDAISDLYALGVMWWQFLRCGPLPAVVSDAAVGEHVPVEIAGTLRALVDPDRARRPASALEVLRSLGDRGDGPRDLRRVIGAVDACPERAYHALFHGPDVVLRLASDAAHELARRVDDDTAKAADELAGWAAAGLGRWEQGRFRVGRHALERLRSGLCVVHPPARVTVAHDALTWADAPLAAAVEAESVPALVAAAHAARRDGQVEAAMTYLELGLELMDADDPRAVALLRDLVVLALGAATDEACQRALFELERRPSGSADVERLWTLMRAGARLAGGSRGEAGQIVDGLAPFEDDDLETLRVSVRVHGRDGATAVSVEQEVRALEDWAQATSARGARWRGWLGMALYQQGRCVEAAALHEQAAAAREASSAPADVVLTSTAMAAAAWLDAGDLDRAALLAGRARVRAEALRLAIPALHLAWVQRSVAYRREDPVDVDLDLVDAAFAVSRPLGAQIAAVEAAIAWRSGARRACVNLAAKAREVAQERGNGAMRLLLEALVWSVGPRDLPTGRRLASDGRSASLSPGLRVQILGFVAAARPELARDVAEELASAARAIDGSRWCQRRELLSVAEAVSWAVPSAP